MYLNGASSKVKGSSLAGEGATINVDFTTVNQQGAVGRIEDTAVNRHLCIICSGADSARLGIIVINRCAEITAVNLNWAVCFQCIESSRCKSTAAQAVAQGKGSVIVGPGDGGALSVVYDLACKIKLHAECHISN